MDKLKGLVEKLIKMSGADAPGSELDSALMAKKARRKGIDQPSQHSYRKPYDPFDAKRQVTHKAEEKVKDVLKGRMVSYNAGRANEPHKAPSYKQIKARSGPTPDLGKARYEEGMSDRKKRSVRAKRGGIEARLFPEQSGVHSPVMPGRGESTLRSPATSSATPQASSSAYGVKPDRGSKARAMVRQKIGELQSFPKPKLPKSETAGLDKAIEKMRDMTKSYTSSREE